MTAKPLIRRLAGFALCACALAAQAQSSWDAVGNFSIASNLEAPWSYRVRAADGTVSLMGYASPGCRGTPGLACWNTDEGDFDLPMIGLNTTEAEIAFPSGVIPLGTLHLHPGANGERPVLTFTAPAAGTYRLVGHFQMVDREATGVQVQVSQGGKLIIDRPLAAFGDTVTFNLLRKLKAGAMVDFSVDAAGNYANDSTELKVGVLRVQ